MFSFFLGLAAGVTVLLNGPEIRRGIAKATLAGGDAALALGQQARRISARTLEDFEDAFAEAKAERSQSTAAMQGMAELRSELKSLRDEIQSLGTKAHSSSVQ
jgi:hypothetical protein